MTDSCASCSWKSGTGPGPQFPPWLPHNLMVMRYPYNWAYYWLPAASLSSRRSKSRNPNFAIALFSQSFLLSKKVWPGRPGHTVVTFRRGTLSRTRQSHPPDWPPCSWPSMATCRSIRSVRMTQPSLHSTRITFFHHNVSGTFYFCIPWKDTWLTLPFMLQGSQHRGQAQIPLLKV